MKIVRQTRDELVIQDSGLVLCAILGVVGFPMLAAGILPGRHADLFGAGFFLICAAICLRKTAFTFDAARRQVRWNGRRLFKVSSGEIPFGTIKDIGIEAISGEKGPTYRLSVLTSSGPVPMAYTYGGNRKKYESQRDAILEFIQPGNRIASSLPQGGTAAMNEASIRSLLLQGRKIDAVALVRSSEKLDLMRAMRRVEEIDRTIKTEE
jgi:hypothetical protein